jgi:hypothetical protein
MPVLACWFGHSHTVVYMTTAKLKIKKRTSENYISKTRFRAIEDAETIEKP